ncbi:MAG: DNA polymerase I [Bacteroidetes bacterium]|nr:DNA polymerase I [Bacteroidota bacterium]
MKNKKFVIIDAMALTYKAYFAFINRPLVTSKGEPTSAVYGFVSQLIKILEENKPDYIAVAFDSKEKTFRHEKFESYKSSRAAMPEDMIPQIDRIKQIIEVLKIPIYILPKYEADDLIGTAVREAEEKGLQSFVFTPDKDFNQLVSDKVRIVKPGKSTDEIIIYDVKKVKDEFGFEPKQMIDYLALIGDSSDDIPGVAGIGPKTAIPLIQEFGSVENIYKHIDKILKEGTKKKLLDGKESAFISKELATIDCNVPFEMNFESAKFEKPDFDKLRSIFLELEFKTLYSKLLNVYDSVAKEEAEIENIVTEDISVFDKSKVSYQLIVDAKKAKALADKLSKQSLFVFDTETDSLDYFTLNLVGASFAVKPSEAYFVALNPNQKGNELFSKNVADRLPLSDFVKIFKPVFEDKKIKKVCQNGKFDISVLRSQGIQVNNFYFDTMLASYVIDPDQKHGMDDLSQKYLKYKPIPLSDLIGIKKDPSKIFDVDLNELSNYSAEDADITFRLYEILEKEVEKNKLNKVAYDVEFPLAPVLEDMEREGVNVDKNALKSLSKDLQILIDNYSKEIIELAGEDFNINSPQQLQKILFDKLKLATGKKTKTGFSTDARSLEALRGEHEIIGMILDYRQVSKLKSTYADSLPDLIHPNTGRIHTSFNQTVASTGRLSSNDPNLQNIPIRTEMGKEIRKAFVSRNKEYVLLSADYSQIELRILASITGDEGLTKAFKKGEDIHRSTAALVFMVKPEDVTPDMRRKAKEVNFGILYGIGPFGLKTRLGVTQAHAKEIIETYFGTFKRVKNYMDDCVLKAREKGFAETLLGRRRFLRNINSSNHVVRQFEERVAINMPIQGTAADMIKIAMINIHKELTKKKLKTKMVLQVHDELLFDVHKDEVEEIKPLVKKLMENTIPMNVPILVEIGIGDNWLDAH